MNINITPIDYSYPNPHITFGTSHRFYDNIYKQGITGNSIYTTTRLFREDLNFGELADTIIQNFQDKDKVNIYCMAGSDGSEAYSLAISLMERIPEKDYKKYFPIISTDKDSKIIDSANERRINLSINDIAKLKDEVKSGKKYFINKQDFIYIKNDIFDYNYSSYEPCDELKKAVIFRKANLSDEVQNIEDDGNTVVLCRNVFPYLHPSKISNTIYDLNQALKKGSMFAIGKFDADNTEIRNYLYYYNFCEILNNVFMQN